MSFEVIEIQSAPADAAPLLARARIRCSRTGLVISGLRIAKARGVTITAPRRAFAMTISPGAQPFVLNQPTSGTPSPVP